MRLAAAIAVLAVSLSAALYVHQRHTTRFLGIAPKCSPNAPGLGGTLCANDIAGNTVTVHPSWEDPVAVFIALGGLAVAVAVGPRVKRY